MNLKHCTAGYSKESYIQNVELRYADKGKQSRAAKQNYNNAEGDKVIHTHACTDNHRLSANRWHKLKHRWKQSRETKEVKTGQKVRSA